MAMNNLDTSAFAALFKEAYHKCFGHPMQNPLSETESKLFSGKIFDETGLVIGQKSIKNYSAYILNGFEGKEENPSIATLDTLVRYVLSAPYTDETQRKNKESHYPYWFQYKNQFYSSLKKPVKKRKWLAAAVVSLIIVLVITLLVVFFPSTDKKSGSFTENFRTVSEDSLTSHGWFVQSKEEDFWNRRNDKTGHLTLFTLRGDNWPDSGEVPKIRNLLLREISSDCFTTEIHLSNFIPKQNWQQAGILIMEDTTFSGKTVRLSLMYNDFSGGAPVSRQILIQAITSLGKNFNKPEEIANQAIFSLDSARQNIALINLQNSALKIEKQGKRFRFLYANGEMENSAFKELASREVDMKPKYMGIFALKGFVDNTDDIPAYIKFFSLADNPCDK
jgi:hypothetical protein